MSAADRRRTTPVFRTLLFLAASLAIVPTVVGAQSSAAVDGPLVLDGGSFRYDGGEKIKAINFWGTGFTTEFGDILSTDPEALAEARRVFLWNKVALGIGVAGVTWMIHELVTVEDDLASLDAASNRIPAISLLTLGGMLSAALVGRSHLKNGVRRFNFNRRRSDESGRGWLLPTPAVVRTDSGLALRTTFTVLW